MFFSSYRNNKARKNLIPLTYKRDYRVAIFVSGVVIGIFIMFSLQKSQPVTVSGLNSIKCSVCHYERVVIDGPKSYREHQKRKKAALIHDVKETEYLANLIAGGKP